MVGKYLIGGVITDQQNYLWSHSEAHGLGAKTGEKSVRLQTSDMSIAEAVFASDCTTPRMRTGGR
jgi:hypothetical protein